MVLLASWCGLRLGELTELRRSDVDLGDGVIRVRRAMVCVRGEFRVTTPKSEADIRDVNIPPHLLPTADHMASHVGVEQDALVFPARHGGHLAPGTLYEAYYRRAEVVAVRASLRRVRDPLPGRRLHQLAQHMYKPMPQTTARSAIRGDLSSTAPKPARFQWGATESLAPKGSDDSIAAWTGRGNDDG